MTSTGLARPRAAVALLVALALTALLAAPVAAADPTACRVRDLRTGEVRSRLQAAVAAASAGDTLTVRGTCHGLTTIGKSLRITGIRTATSGPPTLDGDDLGTVLTVAAGVTVTVTDLTIRDGSGPGMPGGGIVNQGTLHLRGSCSVRGNDDTGVGNSGTLRMSDTSSIRGNRGGHSGGGVYNTGTLVLRGSSSIRRNSNEDSSGGVWNAGGTVRLMDASSISGNRAGLGGGGIANGGSLILSGRSSISGNTADTGAGVLNVGSLVMGDSSSIRGNVANTVGGGVHNLASGSLSMSGASSIHHNEATWVGGGGIYNDGGDLIGFACRRVRQTAHVHDNVPDNCWDYVEP